MIPKPTFKLNPTLVERAEKLLNIDKREVKLPMFINDKGEIELPEINKHLETLGYFRVILYQFPNTFIWWFHEHPSKGTRNKFIVPQVYDSILFAENFFQRKEQMKEEILKMQEEDIEAINHLNSFWEHCLTHYRDADFKTIISNDYRAGVLDAVILDAYFAKSKLMWYIDDSEKARKAYELKSKNEEFMKQF